VSAADQGDYEATRELTALIKNNQATQTIRDQVMSEVQPRLEAAATSARTGVLNEIAADFSRLSIEGLDVQQLRTAPTIQELVNRVHSQTREPLLQQVADRDQKIAALEAENTSLKGRVAGKGPSPEPASGARSGANTSTATGLHALFEETAREMGYAR
jgi:hypothetical protein